MLKQGKTWHRGNQKGSVLLTVVIMVMVLFTLTSICLDVIHHSTRVSSRNVQKTQAKLTAERVLTEFINGYKDAKTQEYAGDTSKMKNVFADLMKDYAGADADHPTIIDVSMKDHTGAKQADFDDTFGKTELHIYKTGATGFVVESICTFSTQTQTASAVFETKTKINKVVSHTVESQLGTLVGNQQITNGINGSIYIEKNDGDSDTFKKMSRTENLKSHVYSEFSLRIDCQSSIVDMRNTSRKNNDFDCPDTDFLQAPTLITDGYLTIENDPIKIGTKVGKIDANKRYRTGPTDTTYQANNLGNYDGFVRIDKKLYLPKASSMSFGDSGDPLNQIDIYSHGIIIGRIPSTDIPEHAFKTNDADEIRKIYPLTSSTNELWNYQPSDTTKMHGNVYVYKGYDTSATPPVVIAEQDGSVVVTDGNTLKVDGDLFVEGNIYLFGGGKIECKNLYCESNIITADITDYTPTGVGELSDNNRCAIVTSTLKTYSVDDVPSTIVKVTGEKGKSINREKVRNQFPEDGYDPQTGFVQSDRLGTLYDDCSANDIFQMSVDETDPALYAASKGISEKYADAMLRSFTLNGTDTSTPSAHTVASTSQYKDGSSTLDVVTTDATLLSDSKSCCVYNVNSSMKFAPEQLTPMHNNFFNISYVGYVIKLRKEDIVIALPIGEPIGARFRIDRTERTEDCFVYFMYYDPKKIKGAVLDKKQKVDEYNNPVWKDGKPVYDIISTYTGEDACLYYMGSGTKTLKTSSSFVGTGGYKITPDGVDAISDVKGAAKGAIWMGASTSPQSGVLVGDIDAVNPSTDVTKGADVVANVIDASFDKIDGDSIIMYMVPNDVGFTFIQGEPGYNDPDTSTWSSGNYSGDSYKKWPGNGSKSWQAQGLIYGLNSNIKLGVFESGETGSKMNGLLGQIKGYSVNFLGDQKSFHEDCGMAEGSLLDYVGVKNNVGGSIASVKLMYYQY